jgi:hypothetical protein
MATYKKKDGSDTWHWCRNCSGYPTGSDVKTTTTRPSSDLCNQCKSKESNGTCQS